MTAIDIIGGVYGETCAFPEWNEIYGSAGRAAIGLSEHIDTVRLHTVLPKDQARRIIPNFEAFGIDVRARDGTQLIGFDYLHSLADPVISPAPRAIERQSSFEVEAEIALLYGMMECLPKVKADICVYDPQSPSRPRSFRKPVEKSGLGCVAKRLAVVANANEIKKMSGISANEGAKAVLEKEDAELVIVKAGLRGGVLVFDRDGHVGTVPAYQTESVFSVGSGDVFAAAFARAWGVLEMKPLAAAEYASQAVAQYIETSALPIISIEAARNSKRPEAKLKGGRVYLAGPFRELGQYALINEARQFLRELGMEVFSPVHDIGRGPAAEVVAKDLDAIRKCDAVFVILNGSSPGTLFEVGYAARQKQPVYCVAQNMRSVDLKLPIGSGCHVHHDFVSALHQIAWRP